MEDQMERIPFSKEEERTIGSMSRWMRFMAAVGLVGAVVMLLVVVVAIGLYSGTQAFMPSSAGTMKLQSFMQVP